MSSACDFDTRILTKLISLKQIDSAVTVGIKSNRESVDSRATQFQGVKIESSAVRHVAEVSNVY